MTKGKKYTHPGLIDVEVYIQDLLEQDEDSLEFSVHYWNPFYMMFHTPMDIIRIKREDLRNWTEVTDVILL